jgi:protein SCO1
VGQRSTVRVGLDMSTRFKMRKAGSFRLCLAFLLVSSEICSAQQPKDKNGARQAETRPDITYHGGMVSPPMPKPRFTLTDTSGNPFDFWSATDGYVTLLFFGYTHCASVCPVQVSYVASALRKIPKDLAHRFRVVFVTTDPARDNPHQLRSWLNHFDRSFIGLTGAEADLDAAQTAAHVPFAKGSPDGHAAFVLAYTADNLAHVIYPTGISEADWVHDLPRLATETWTSSH